MTKYGAVEWDGKILLPQVNVETEARPIEKAKYSYYNALVNSKGIGYSPFENMTYSEFDTYLKNNPSMQKEFKEFVASDILRRNPYQQDSGADDYLSSLTDEERQYVEGTRVWDKQSKTYKDKIKQGWAEIVDFMSGNPDNLEQYSYLPTSNIPTEGYNENVQRRYNQMSSPNYSSEEKQSASGLDLVDGVFTWAAKPLQYAIGQTGLRDYKNPQGEDYSWQDVMSGKQNNATLPEDIVTDLTNFIPLSSLGKLGKIKYVDSSVDDALKGLFKSEINWGAWNKEIPSNKKLMAEYLDIERKAKAKGTWMKNPDGSQFQGTPEQFVQQNSQNFKKAFPNIYKEEGNVTPLIHHSKNKFTFFDESKNMSGTGANIGGKGVFTIPKPYYDNYITHSFDDLKIKDGKARVLINYGDVRYDLYANTDGLKVFSRGDAFSNTPKTFNTNYRTDPWKAIIPYDKTIKSAVGNNGMFDVSNPNIYKGLLPSIPISALLAKER